MCFHLGTFSFIENTSTALYIRNYFVNFASIFCPFLVSQFRGQRSRPNCAADLNMTNQTRSLIDLPSRSNVTPVDNSDGELEKRLAFVKGPYFCEQMHDRSPKQNGIQHENAHGCAHTGELCRG